MRFEILEVDSTQHRLWLKVALPLGITVDEDLNCVPISRARRVNYRCGFGFRPGWRGAIVQAVLRRELDAGPADSLSRLKRAAERRYASMVSQIGSR